MDKNNKNGEFLCPICGGSLIWGADFMASEVFCITYENDDEAISSNYRCSRCGRLLEITDPEKSERNGEYKEYWNPDPKNNT